MCSKAGIIIVVIVIIAAIAGYYYYNNKESYKYATLGSYGYLSPLFEPDVLRRCATGSYMYTSNPELTNFCSTVPQAVLDKVACKKSFHGRPIRLPYTAPAYTMCPDNAIACGSQQLVFN